MQRLKVKNQSSESNRKSKCRRQIENPSQSAMLVMVKAPRTGEVKTRLTPFLSLQQAAELASCFAQDTIAKSLQITRNVIVAYTPSDGRTTLEELLPDGLIWIEQRGENLGERMTNAFLDAFAKGFSPIVMIGTDSPTLPVEFIEKTIESLSNDESDLVLGKTEDGGYYLIALRHSFDEKLLTEIEWSTPKVFEQTVRNAERLNLRLKTLPVWYDVDEPQDLIRLEKELRDDEENQRRAPSTCRWLMQKPSPLGSV
jgi:hypothetical protein